MKQALFDNWITALESGKIPQCPNTLGKGDARCCLGVLLDVAGIPGVADEETGEIWYEDNNSTLPTNFAEDQGMDQNGALLADLTSTPDMLSTLNDNGIGFAEIAKRLRANPLSYIKELTP